MVPRDASSSINDKHNVKVEKKWDYQIGCFPKNLEVYSHSKIIQPDSNEYSQFWAYDAVPALKPFMFGYAWGKIKVVPTNNIHIDSYITDSRIFSWLNQLFLLKEHRKNVKLSFGLHLVSY